MYHEHVTTCPEQYRFGNVAHDIVPGSIHTTVADHDEIGTYLVGGVDDRPGRAGSR